MKLPKRFVAAGFAVVTGFALLSPVSPAGAATNDEDPGEFVRLSGIEPPDGTSGGGELLGVVGDLLFFTSTDTDHGLELWVSDGTQNGTKLAKDITPGPGSTSFTSSFAQVYEPVTFNDDLVFVANGELWVSDGTDAGTTIITNYDGAETDPDFLQVAGGKLYFAGRSTENAIMYGLYVSDGTVGGTTIVATDFDILQVTDFLGFFEPWAPIPVAELGNKVAFLIPNNSGSSMALWTSDGTTAGTERVVDNIFTRFGLPLALDGYLYFNGESLQLNSVGSELYRTDGTASGTTLVKDINDGLSSSTPGEFIEFDGRLFFGAQTDADGYELWATDGTEVGTTMVKDIATGSDSGNPYDFTVVGDLLYFNAETTDAGSEPWVSDGTTEGTVALKDINPDGDSEAHHFTAVGDTAYFAAKSSNSSGHEVWMSDGTTEGTSFVASLDPDDVRDKQVSFRLAGDTLFAIAEDNDDEFVGEIWALDVSAPHVCAEALTGQFAGTSGLDGAVARLYMTTFLRQPDPAGHAYWSDLVASDILTFTAVANYFMDSQEFLATYEWLTNDEFIELLYQNVMCRQPDEAGATYWLGHLNDGTLDRGDVAIQFSESAESKAKTGTS